MALILLQRPESGGRSLVNGITTAVVEADDAAAAREFMAAKYEGDSPWSDATATTIAAGLETTLEGYTYRVQLTGAAGLSVPVDVSVVGDSDDVFDDIGGKLVTALNATADIANAAYVGASNTLTVATGSGGDDLGDGILTVTVTPPGFARPVASFVGTIVDEGVATDPVSVVLEEPTAIPGIFGEFAST